MCLIAVAVDMHPQWPLIIAGNRDEFHDRPASDAAWWPDYPDILGGRDLEAGGTWLAVSRHGRFAAVTNFRDADHRPANLRSRGHLVTDFLQTSVAPVEHVEGVHREAYAGFNLLAAACGQLVYLSNRGGGCEALPRGIYGLSNATLDTPWTKVRRTRERLEALIDADNVNEASLMRVLDDRERAPAAEIDAADMAFPLAHALSAPFIVQPEYGTRCSTVVTFGSDGGVHFAERRFDRAGRRTGESRYTFTIGLQPE